MSAMMALLRIGFLETVHGDSEVQLADAMQRSYNKVVRSVPANIISMTIQDCCLQDGFLLPYMFLEQHVVRAT